MDNDNVTKFGSNRRTAIEGLQIALRAIPGPLSLCEPHGNAQSSRSEYNTHKEFYAVCNRHIDQLFEVIQAELDRIPSEHESEAFHHA